MREPSEQLFLKDVSEHQMAVLMHSGVYRHLRFKKSSDSNHWFDLLTWPSSLTINGDMGTWTFSRLEDMFMFFRSTESLKTNPSYWSEKLRHGVHGGSDMALRFDCELFRKEILGRLSDYEFEGADLSELTQAVTEEALCYDSEHELLTAVAAFEHRFDDGRKFHFDSCELPDGKTYSYHFLWCLYAIVWGIQQWDSSSDAALVAAREGRT